MIWLKMPAPKQVENLSYFKKFAQYLLAIALISQVTYQILFIKSQKTYKLDFYEAKITVYAQNY